MVSRKKQKKLSKKKTTSSPSVKAEKKRTIYHLLIKIATGALMVCGVVVFTDIKGYFNPDEVNNHTQKKWDSFYEFTEKNEIDMVLVGNSHLYTGINPKHLSCALGANCFVLASPGTTLTDAYYCLKEAISVCKPKIAVVETFTIKDYDSHHLTAGGLADQFKSFHARKNIGQKLATTPVLFTSDNYLAAWSNTIRNHNFIFTDRKQIKKNLEEKKSPKKEKLYLGRFVLFAEGMKDSTLLKYNIPGAVDILDGNEFSTSKEAKEYIRKTVELCRENDIELIFLTLPMYDKHIKDYDIWKSRLNEDFSKYDPVWLDMQSPYDQDTFVPECFENTVKSNQHMTYNGSLAASYKLAHFIQEKFPEVLPDRSEDAKWKNLFYGEEGYYENFSPNKNDSISVLFQHISIPEKPAIKEINVLSRKEYDLMLVKVERQDHMDLNNKILHLFFKAEIDGVTSFARIDVRRDSFIDPLKHYLFFSTIRKGINILELIDIEISDSGKPAQ